MTDFAVPVACPLYGPLPYAYRGCPQLCVVFRTTSAVMRRLVPPPLVPNPDGLMFVMTGEMHSDEFGSNREAFIAAPASLGDLTGNYAVLLYLDSPAAIASGREVWGWPKKDATLHGEASDRLVTASVMRGGATIVSARLDVERSAAPSDLALDPTWFNLKLIPSVEWDAPPDVHQITATTLEGLGVREAVAGAATLAFGDGPEDPLAELIEVVEVIGGVAFLLDCDLTLGRVVHDYRAGGAPATRDPARAPAPA